MNIGKATIFTIACLVFFIGGMLLAKFLDQNKQINLDYYPDQKMLVNGKFGIEVQYYHPTKNPGAVYCFNNDLAKTCIRIHE